MQHSHISAFHGNTQNCETAYKTCRLWNIPMFLGTVSRVFPAKSTPMRESSAGFIPWVRERRPVSILRESRAGSALGRGERWRTRTRNTYKPLRFLIT